MHPVQVQHVTPAMTLFAQEVVGDPNTWPMGATTAPRVIDGVRLVGRVVVHHKQEATGRTGTFRACELWVVDDQRGVEMSTSPAGLALIAELEGEVLHAYLDVAGIRTIGVGHVILPSESFPPAITHETATELLAVDVLRVEIAVRELGVALSQNEFDALVSFAFNVGTGAFAGSTLVKLLRTGNRTQAADQFLAWDRAGGKVVEGLRSRRIAERAMFLREEDTDPNVPVDAGTTVRGVQKALNSHGAKLVVDGIDGPATKAAVRAFQAAHGLVADGIVGPKTRAALQAPE